MFYSFTLSQTHTHTQPKSILLTSDHKQLKLTDFSLARYIETGNQLQELRGSVEYMAPEAVSLLPLTTAADIWSAGAIAYFMYVTMSIFSFSLPPSYISPSLSLLPHPY